MSTSTNHPAVKAAKDYMSEVYGEGTLVLPQNINKSTRPTKLLAELQLSANHIIWAYQPASAKCVGVMVSKYVTRTPQGKAWLLGHLGYRKGKGTYRGYKKGQYYTLCRFE